MTLHRDTATRAAHSGDFGGLARGQCQGVARPRDVQEVAALVAWARRQGVRLTIRGGGLAQSGQSVPVEGLALCTERLDAIHALDRDARVVRCGAAVSFRQLLERTLPLGLAPRAMPLNLDLTLGGVLSAGGVGSTSHRHGPVAANVAALMVVTGDGQVRHCSRELQPDLFNACLCGVGRFGVICEATLELRVARARVRTHYLRYSDADAFLADQDALVTGRAGPVPDHLEGHCVSGIFGLTRATPDGPRTPLLDHSFGLQVSCEFDDGPPDSAAQLRGLSHDRLLHTEDSELADYCARYDARFAMMRATGAWSQLHPWFECFVGVDAIGAFLPRALAKIPPLFGDGHRILHIDMGGAPASLARPPGPRVVAFAMLPAGIPPDARTPAMQTLDALDGLCRELGGKRYLSGWLGAFDAGSHHGPENTAMARRRAAYDPDGVFESLLFPHLPRTEASPGLR